MPIGRRPSVGRGPQGPASRRLDAGHGIILVSIARRNAAVHPSLGSDLLSLSASKRLSSRGGTVVPDRHEMGRNARPSWVVHGSSPSAQFPDPGADWASSGLLFSLISAGTTHARIVVSSPPEIRCLPSEVKTTWFRRNAEVRKQFLDFRLLLELPVPPPELPELGLPVNEKRHEDHTHRERDRGHEGQVTHRLDQLTLP